MGKALVIVESPAKASTINKYLGNQYIVKSSIGHIRDLYRLPSQKKGRMKADIPSHALSLSENIRRMGVDPDDNWKAKYIVIPGKDKVVKELKQLAANADCVYLATDKDREGEAISWHLQEVLGNHNYHRVTFNEITQKAIQDAFSKPSHVDMNMVHAQMTRRYLDRVVGFNVSPVLWNRVRGATSAGRVQSVAVRLIVEREQEINAFVPDEYWKLALQLTTKAKDNILFQLQSIEDKVVKVEDLRQFTDKPLRDKLTEVFKQHPYKVDGVVTKPTSTKPKAPFTTSSLQQAAATYFGYGVKRTMMAAQKLYEQGYITYMRTDSTAISDDALHMVRNYIQSKYGNRYLSEHPIRYGNKANAQEAHECIRCTDCSKDAQALSLFDDQRNIYNLIRSQFIACQMTPALYDSTTLTVLVDKYTFTAKGRIMLFDGYTKVMQVKSKQDKEEQVLPHVVQGDPLYYANTEWEQTYTKPPSRFNEASLVKELEKRGIGRPSTYASIVGTIQDRGYVEVKDKRFYALPIGMITIDRLTQSFPEMMDYGFTAAIEQQLDSIADGKLDYIEALNAFWLNLSNRIAQAKKPPEEGGMKPTINSLTPIPCEKCQRPMTFRPTKEGAFLGCSGYSDKENKCKHTSSLIPTEAKALHERYRCPTCNCTTKDYYVNETTLLHCCSNVLCGTITVAQGHYPEAKMGHIQNGLTCECEKCNNAMFERTGRFGRYLRCDNCNNIRGIMPDGTVAPPRKPVIDFPELKCNKKGSHFVLRESVSGNIFLSAHNFPRCREMRNITVNEIIQYKDRLPDYLHYLAAAPAIDEAGNETVVRFSKAKNERYVGVPNFKGMKSVSTYRDGAWTPLTTPKKNKKN